MKIELGKCYPSFSKSGDAVQISDVLEQIVKVWSPVFVPELFEKQILGSLVNREYEGTISEEGDTVYVSQISELTAQNKAVGDGHETFTSQALNTERIAVTADRVISSSIKFGSLVKLQSQIGKQDSTIRAAMLRAMSKALNNYLFSLCSPSTSAPDHNRSGITDFNKAELLANRLLASQAFWPDENRFLLLDPSYYNDMLNDTTMTGADYVGDMPVVGGKMVQQRFGFNIIEDSSEGLGNFSSTGVDAGLAFHPDFMYLVTQLQPTWEIAPLTANEQFGYVMVCKMVAGAKLGHQGSRKHIKIYNS